MLQLLLELVVLFLVKNVLKIYIIDVFSFLPIINAANVKILKPFLIFPLSSSNREQHFTENSDHMEEPP